MLPGANNAAITRQTLLSGRGAGLLTVAGSSTGILVWTGTAAVGLSAVLLTNPNAYLLLRLAGAVVLCVATSHPGRRSFAVGVATSLGAIWAAVSGTWFCLYVWTVDQARARASKPHVQRLMHAATGVTMLGLGIVVAVSA